MRKKKDPTKRDLRRQAEYANLQRDAAFTQVAILERKLDDMRRERETERSLVERICRLIQSVQPNSSLLPTFMQTREVDPRHTRMVPPRYAEPLFGPGTVNSLDVIHPINLHDLHVYLEENYATWDRLVTIAFNPSTSGLSALRLHYKMSDESLHSAAARQVLSAKVVRRFFRALEEQFK